MFTSQVNWIARLAVLQMPLSVPVWFQIRSPHHSDQMSQKSQVPRSLSLPLSQGTQVLYNSVFQR